MNTSAYPGEKSTYGKSSYKGRGSIRKSSKSKETDVLFEKIQKQAEELKSEIAKLKDDLAGQKKAFKRIEDELVDFNQMDVRQKFDMKQRAMLKKLFTEFVTPLEMNMNIDFKQLRKYLEDCMMTMKEHSERIHSTQKTLDEMQVTMMRQIKN